MTASAEKAVILARGLGTRMRKEDPSAGLSPEQADAACAGVKALIPIVPSWHGHLAHASQGRPAPANPSMGETPMPRPFLDYVLSALADAGWRRVCLVIGPEHDAVRQYYGSLPTRRVRVEFAVQERPRGTADAVAAAEAFADGDPFVCINSDNYYPVEALRALREMEGCGLAAFEKDAMLAGSNIPPERIGRFAVVRLRADGRLEKVVEKPTGEDLEILPGPLHVSMNCWRFDGRIFPACRAIGPSARGELEITDAVQHAIDRMGVPFNVFPCRAAVLDMTGREDIASIARHLAGTRVDL